MLEAFPISKLRHDDAITKHFFEGSAGWFVFGYYAASNVIFFPLLDRSIASELVVLFGIAEILLKGRFKHIARFWQLRLASKKSQIIGIIGVL